jgi:phytoene dehydrogenase-like protein
VSRYDSIIIGAGHNGLVCAAYLAKSGQRVLVLEASANSGGLAAGREFHPGFRASIAHSVSHFSEKVSDDLNLSSHGFEMTGGALATVGLRADHQHIVVEESTLHGASEKDSAAFAKYIKQMQRFSDVLKPFWTRTMPRIGANSFADIATFAHIGLNLRRMGKSDMQEFLRVASLPARDLMDENFDDELVKSTLSWDGLVGAKLAPRSPNGAVLAMLYRMSGNSKGMHTIPAGGVSGLVDALSAAATSAGVEIRHAAMVDRILVEGSADGLAATGVQLASGDTLLAERVVSATDPKRTFLNMVGVEYLDIGFTNRIRRLRCDGYVAKLHLALRGEPRFSGLEKANGRMIIAPELDAIEFAYDHAKYGECPQDPVMEVVVPSMHDDSLAPAGQHVLSAHVMYVPYALKGGWTDEARQQMLQRSIDTLEKYAPGIREQILHSELLTPADLEQRYHVTGGHWHHTEFAMDQMLMMRPTYEAAQYHTPIPGLYLCSAGCHPGGGLMGAAGHNAAREILR